MDYVQSNRSKILARRETRSAYLFLLPSLVFFLGFVIFPMILCVYTSFFDATMGKNVADQFIGFRNYAELFPKSPDKHLDYRFSFRSCGSGIFLMGGFRHLQNERAGTFRLPLYILPSCSNRFRSGYCGMEMDVS